MPLTWADGVRGEPARSATQHPSPYRPPGRRQEQDDPHRHGRVVDGLVRV